MIVFLILVNIFTEINSKSAIYGILSNGVYYAGNLYTTDTRFMGGS